MFHPFQGLIAPRNMSIVQRERERRTRPERKCLSLFIKFSVPWPLLCLLNFSGQKITASRSTNTAFSKPGLHTTSPVRPNNAGCLFRLCQQTNARLPSTQPPHEAGQAERKSVCGRTMICPRQGRTQNNKNVWNVSQFRAGVQCEILMLCWPYSIKMSKLRLPALYWCYLFNLM